MLKDQLPDYVQNLFEKRAGGFGFDLHDFAVMVATMENLVHQETLHRLDHTYRALERSKEDPLDTEESYDVIDAYMISFILGMNFSAMTPAQLKENVLRIEEAYPTWRETQQFVRDVQNTTGPHREEVTFENVASVVEEVGERYGRWQARECVELKSELVSIEDRGTGRVRLADFYGSALHDGKWQFSESVDYLRQLGALDESDPANLRVIIPNYVMSPSNCVAGSSYYSVCCLDECEDILGHLEEKLGTHEATTGEISALIASLPSLTSENRTSLPRSLFQRLDEVAQYHGGRIPLHGRLFAQWLHHAYPRQCPYPHVTGTTNPKRAEDFLTATGNEAAASEAEMQQHAGAVSPSKRPRAQQEAVEDYGMWTMEEELTFRHQQAAPVDPVAGVRGALRGVVFVVAVVSVTLALLQSVGPALVGAQDVLPKQMQSKYCV
jgi:hypothetical protein